MIKTITLICSILMLGTSYASAEKPEWAGNGKSDMPSKAIAQAPLNDTPDTAGTTEESMGKTAKHKMKDRKDKLGDKHDHHNDGHPAEPDQDEASHDHTTDVDMNAKKDMKQHTSDKNKNPDERKELDKGSEKGQAMREEHSKKWWKFWE